MEMQVTLDEKNSVCWEVEDAVLQILQLKITEF